MARAPWTATQLGMGLRSNELGPASSLETKCNGNGYVQQASELLADCFCISGINAALLWR